MIAAMDTLALRAFSEGIGEQMSTSATSEVVRALIGAGAITIALVFFRVGWLILIGDSNEYEGNRRRIKSWRNVYRGTVPTKYDGARDDKLAAGVAIDARRNRWVEQGRLSDEALRDVLAS